MSYDDTLRKLTDIEHSNMCKVANFFITLDPDGTDQVFTSVTEIKNNIAISSWGATQTAIQHLCDMGYLRVSKHDLKNNRYDFLGGLTKQRRDRVRAAVAEMKEAGVEATRESRRRMERFLRGDSKTEETS